MEEYRVEKLKIINGKNYVPAQLIGKKRVIRTMETMDIDECKRYISEYKSERTKGDGGKWILIEV